jgi:hypothetical protein
VLCHHTHGSSNAFKLSSELTSLVIHYELAEQQLSHWQAFQMMSSKPLAGGLQTLSAHMSGSILSFFMLLSTMQPPLHWIPPHDRQFSAVILICTRHSYLHPTHLHLSFIIYLRITVFFPLQKYTL